MRYADDIICHCKTEQEALYQDQGDYEQTLPLYQRALAIREKVLGAEHPHTALSLNNLGLLYEDQGQFEQALPLLERAVEIWEKSLGQTHPWTQKGQENLMRVRAAVQAQSGRVE